MDNSIISSGCAICVDLDGTFSRSDTLVESLLVLIRRHPLMILLLPLWLLRGKAGFKAEVARHARLDPAGLAYNDELAGWLRQEASAGRKIVLATGADRELAGSIAAHHGFFSDVVASDGKTNMTGANKAEALSGRFGDFVYIGNSHVDVPVWSRARAAMLMASSSHAEESLSRHVRFERVWRNEDVKPSTLLLWAHGLRLHQWAKNLLMFVPLALAHQIFDIDKVTTVAFAFLAFSLCASSVYLLNDLLDLAADRQHPRKRLRPFASGNLPLEHGLVAIPLLLTLSFGLALWTGLAFAANLALYYAVTLAYSFGLKRRALIDVFTLASLYTLRIIAGAVAVSVMLSPWLLAFSIFIFLSLAVAKRVAELESGRQRGVEELAGRGYRIGDFGILLTLGVAAGYAAVVVLTLYISAPESDVLYPRHDMLWLLPPLILFWISRVWLLTHRGEMHDDPIVFALKDGTSRFVAIIAAVIFMAAATPWPVSWPA